MERDVITQEISKQVSWLRHRDTRLLTIGLLTFTPDRRISAIHRSSSEDWVLEIRSTRIADLGKLRQEMRNIKLQHGKRH
jgi:hypothetical protein